MEPPDVWAGGEVIFSYASDVGRRGKIVGRYDVQGATNYGFLLDDGTYTKIEYPGSASSAALGINNKGDIAGGYTGDGIVRPGEILRRGFLLIDGNYISIDVPGCTGRVEFGGATCTTLRKINGARQVVGFYTTATGISGFIANPD